MWALICILHKSLDLNYLSPLLKNWISIVNVLPAIHLPALEQALYTPCSTSNTLTCSRTRSVHSMFFQEYTYLLQTQICTLLVLPGIHVPTLDLDLYTPCSTRNTLICFRTRSVHSLFYQEYTHLLQNKKSESNAQIFSSLDMFSGYWQLNLDSKTKHRTAFICHENVYQYKRIAFFLQGSPSAFMSVMSDVLREMNWKYTLVYMDDILIFSKNF